MIIDCYVYLSCSVRSRGQFIYGKCHVTRLGVQQQLPTQRLSRVATHVRVWKEIGNSGPLSIHMQQMGHMKTSPKTEKSGEIERHPILWRRMLREDDR